MEDKFFDIKDKVVFITGAAGHLGSAISKRLNAAGAHLFINGRNKESLENLVQTLDPKAGKIFTLGFDVSNEDSVKEAVQKIQNEFARLDGLVNNAFAPLSGSVYDTTVEDFQECFNINVSAVFNLCQKFLPLLQKEKTQQSSSIVNIASMYGMVSPDPSIYGDSGMNNPPFYGASKAAVIQMSRYLACHIADRGIRTNSVSPGPFPPENVSEKNPEFHKKLCSKNPLGRIGNPEEVAAAIHFLLSSDSSYINGINMPVDGGWTAW